MIRTEFLSRPVQLEKYRDYVLWFFIEEYYKKSLVARIKMAVISYTIRSQTFVNEHDKLCHYEIMFVFRIFVIIRAYLFFSAILFLSSICFSFYLYSLFFSLFSFFFLYFNFFLFSFFYKIPGHNWFIDVARFSCMFYRHLITIKNIFFRIP